jgi:hypothetical protein
LKPESYTTQSRFGSFTYKRFTVPQEVHRSAKRLSLFSFSDSFEKAFLFLFAEEFGTYVTPTTRSRNNSLTEAIDTATPPGRAMWQMIGVLAEFERSLISERTRAGVKAAQRRGVKFGRKVKLTREQIDHARKLIDKGEARQYVADLLNVGRSTLYRALAD